MLAITTKNLDYLIKATKNFHLDIVKSVRESILKQSSSLSQVSHFGYGDTSYKIDLIAEEKIEKYANLLAEHGYSVEIIAEGIGHRQYLSNKSQPEYSIIIDPLDGTRGIMYDFRSSFVLTGIASYDPNGNTLKDIEIAVQTEVPPSKQNQISQLWAIKNQGAFGQLIDLDTHETQEEPLKTSMAKNIDHGFAVFVNYFPGNKAEIGQIADDVFQKVQGKVELNQSIVFDDQYICTAGQLYLLITGRYRFLADIRPLYIKSGLTAHPYDLCTLLIATEAGALITDPYGEELNYPLDTDTQCGLIAYANPDIKNLIEPVLLPLLRQKLS